jgi:hypothetical protein
MRRLARWHIEGIDRLSFMDCLIIALWGTLCLFHFRQARVDSWSDYLTLSWAIPTLLVGMWCYSISPWGALARALYLCWRSRPSRKQD